MHEAWIVKNWQLVAFIAMTVAQAAITHWRVGALEREQRERRESRRNELKGIGESMTSLRHEIDAHRSNDGNRRAEIYTRLGTLEAFVESARHRLLMLEKRVFNGSSR